MQFLNYDHLSREKWIEDLPGCVWKKQLHPEPNAGCVTLGSKNYNQAIAELVIAVEKFCPTLFLHICFTSAILGGFFSINGLFTVVKKNPSQSNVSSDFD